MPKISMTQDLNVSADQLWQMIGHFNALPDWHPSVDKSELSKAGETRTLSLAGGGQIIEKLESTDHDSKTYTYSIVDSPLPVKKLCIDHQGQRLRRQCDGRMVERI